LLRSHSITQEETLAGPFTPVVLAVIAAVTTGAVVAGVVAGPGVMNCAQRSDFSQCIAETFFGAAPAIADTEPLVEEAVPVAGASESQAPAVGQDPVAVVTAEPTFGLVRVEPDGSAVIAGSASPASEVELYANGELLGSEMTEAGGDFVYVTADPLPSGGVELRLLDVASGEFATTSIVVIVQDDRTSEPLVVASEPGAASDILQGLEPGQPVEQEEAPVAMTLAAVEADEPAADAVEPDAEAAAPEAEPAVAAEPEVVEEPADDVIEIASAPASAVENAVPETEMVEEPAADVAQQETDVAQQETDIAEQDVASVEEPVEQEAPAPVVAVVPPTIDAVEIDGDRNFFAGGGTDNHAVRLYVENRPVGTTEVEDGRWLIEAINVLTDTAQRVRVDMLNPDGSVAGRAEVNFVLDLPAEDDAVDEPAEAPVVVAEAPAPTSDAQVTEEVAAEPVAEAAPADEPVVTEPATEVPATEVPVAEVPVAELPVVEEPVVEEPVVEEATEAPVPTLVGTAVGDRTTSGQVIIRRGDNLWTIARRVYGEGLRYTQIYEANANTIRNPDLIYPGQVFDLPGTDMVIGQDQ
jgi:hypothetical protein